VTNHYEYYPNFLYLEEAAYLYSKLNNEIPWHQVKYYKPERGYVITPRQTWCAGIHNRLDLKKFILNYNEIPEWLLPLKKLVEERCDQKFNFMLFSKYRDEKDSIAYHSDDERFLGENPTIASVSVGQDRPFLLKNKKTKVVEEFNLTSGSLFIMKGLCQKNYLHTVPKQQKELAPRISITFRNGINKAASQNYYYYNTPQDTF